MRTAGSAAEALAILQADEVDAVFLDIRMPGIDGLALAGILARFATPPPVVFVTAYDTHAVEAFDVAAVDYLLKPIRPSAWPGAGPGAARTARGAPGPPRPHRPSPPTRRSPSSSAA